jgi:hypothetical protein
VRNGRPIWAEPPLNFADYDLRDKATISFGLARFMTTFGRDRFHISLHEDFAVNETEVFRSVFKWAGLDPNVTPNVDVMVPNRVARLGMINRAMGSARLISSAKRVVPRRLHATANRAALAGFRLNRRVVERPPLNAQLRDRLRTDLRPEVERLSELSGLDLVSRWWSKTAP